MWFVVPWEHAQVYVSHPKHQDMLWSTDRSKLFHRSWREWVHYEWGASQSHSIFVLMSGHWGCDRYTWIDNQLRAQVIRHNTHFIIVSPLCWNCSCNALLESPLHMKWRKMATCSAANTCCVPLRPAHISSVVRCPQNMNFCIPISLWKHSSCPPRSSSSQCCPERIDVCWGVLTNLELIRDVHAGEGALTARHVS